MSFLARLWVLASVFVIPFWIFDLEIGKIAIWLLVGAVFGAGWHWRHRQEPDPIEPTQSAESPPPQMPPTR